MDSVYSSLNVSPRKKRCPPDFDDNTTTPKKLRIQANSKPSPHAAPATQEADLPAHLSRLHAIQVGLNHALAHALATCAVSPTADTGVVRNVLNHLSLATYTGLPMQVDTDDLRRLCWLWEWDAKSLNSSATVEDDDENPFVDAKPVAKGWARGSMGIVLSPTTHFMKNEGKRVAAYGIGIEVEMDIDKDMGSGMAAVARWTANSPKRVSEFKNKLLRWIELNADLSPIPHIPLANFPTLKDGERMITTMSAQSTPTKKVSQLLTPSDSPSKKSYLKNVIPFPGTPSRSKDSSPNKASIFPQTPSTRGRLDSITALQRLRTPSRSVAVASELPSPPVTPARSGDASNPQTPSTSRRQALYERVRQRSLSPVKGSPSTKTTGFTRDQMLKLGQEETRRRCLMGRLGGVAESVWMLFSTPPPGSSNPTVGNRKRRALPHSEVMNAVIKSSPVPISSAEASESLDILGDLCPFFIKPLKISGEEWLEMPAATLDIKTGGNATSSPGRSEDDITRSPRRIKKEGGGLREVREIIRREIESQE